MVTIVGMTEHYRKAFSEHQAKVLAEATVLIEADLVRREDFSKLTATVERLAEAQERTEHRMDSLVIRIDTLAEAQRRTETELERLAAGQERLAAGQERLVAGQQQLTAGQERLTAGQERLTAGQERLTAGQERLTEAMSSLAWTVRDTQKQLGGLGQTAGYALEAYALERVPKLLAKRYGFVETSALPEVFQRMDGTADEIDVVVRGTIEGQPVVFLCEVKSNVTAREVRDFQTVAERVRPFAGCGDVRLLFFGYRAGSEARAAIVAAGGYLVLPHAVIIEPA